MGFVVTWLLLAVLWVGLSGFLDTVHLAFGFVSVTLVSVLSHKHLTGGGPVGPGARRMLRLARFLPWLVWQMAQANWDVLLRVLGFRPLDPRLVRVRSGLATEFGLTTLANSITLTPGTVTIDIADGEFLVHAISPEAGDAAVLDRMVARVRRVEGVA